MSCQFRGISLQTWKNSRSWHASSRLFSVSALTYSAVTSHLTCFIREWVTANANKLLSEHQSNQWLCFKTYTVHPGNANFREWLAVLLINALAKENHGLLSLKMDIYCHNFWVIFETTGLEKFVIKFWATRWPKFSNKLSNMKTINKFVFPIFSVLQSSSLSSWSVLLSLPAVGLTCERDKSSKIFGCKTAGSIKSE